jgi:quercetin dioxygenase-like cupin family protein
MMSPQTEQRSVTVSVTVTEVAKWPIDGMEGKEGRILTVEYPPGVHAPPHRHPGWQFIYVLEGKVVSQMEGEPAREYEPGQAWYEARDHLHQNIGNPSPDTWAKILVFYLTEPGQPVLVFEEERDAEAADERNDR